MRPDVCKRQEPAPLGLRPQKSVAQTAGASPGRPFRGHDPRLSTNSQRGSQQHAHSAGVSRADPLTGLCSSRAPACLLGGELPGAERARAPPAGCLRPPVFRGNTSEGPSVCVQRAVRRHWRVTPRHAPARSSSLRPPAPPRRGLPAGQSCWPDVALRCRLLAGRGRAGLPPLPAVSSPQASVCALRVDARPRRGASPGVERSLTHRLQV